RSCTGSGNDLHWRDIIHPDDLEGALLSWTGLIKHQAKSAFTGYRTKKGEDQWLSVISVAAPVEGSRKDKHRWLCGAHINVALLAAAIEGAVSKQSVEPLKGLVGFEDWSETPALHLS